MSRWQRLSGYLHTKPTGAFRHFKVSQRQWYVFDETTNILRVYRNEDEASAPNKEPVRVINIANAVFYIDSGEFNQFVITSEGKEHILQAETEEAMILWLDTLQTKRNEALQNDPNALIVEETTPPLAPITEQKRLPKLSLAKLPSTMNRSISVTSYDVNAIHCSPPMNNAKLWRMPSSISSSFAVQPSLSSRPSTPTSPATSETKELMHILKDIGMQSRGSPSTERQATTASVMRADDTTVNSMMDNEEAISEPLIVPTTSTLSNQLRPLHASSNTLQLTHQSSTEQHISGEGMNKSPDRQYSGGMPLEVSTKQSDLTADYNGTEGGEKLPADPNNGGIIHKRTSDSSGLSCGYRLKRSDSERSAEMRSELVPSENRKENTLAIVRDLQVQLEASHERELWLRHELTRREASIAELDHRLSLLEDTEDRPSELSIPVGASCATLRGMLHDMEKKQRALQNKINFLVKEVRDLASVRQMLTDHGTKQARYTKKLTIEVLKWKRDFVKLLESCIGAFRLDTAQGLMFSDYGRQKCKERLTELLEEARRKDPTLPSINKPKNEDCHVDVYGFKHSYADETTVMHYVCRHLHEFFGRQQITEDQLIAQWTEIMKHPTRELSRDELKYLCRAGIPSHFRGGVWRMLVHGEMKQIMFEKGPQYYNRLISEISESKVATNYRKQISLDLLRTMPNNIQFDSLEAPGIQKLQEVLQAYSIHNPLVGYCQGMNFLVAVALLFLNKEDAFWCLTAILEKYLPEKYFNCGLISAQVDQLVLKDLLSSKLPRLAEHIQNMEIDISAITLNWFLALFYDSVPFETLIRIWDIFLLEGSKCLFRFALALLKRNEEMLLFQVDTISFWKCLKSATRLTYDADSLVKTAYEELHPFASRSTLATLQAHHHEILNKEMSEKQRLWRNVFKEVDEEVSYDEHVVMRRKGRAERACIQAATSYEDGRVWICHGGKFQTQFSIVDLVNNRMSELALETDMRASCIHNLNDQILLVGLMSGKLCAYSNGKNEQLWQVPVHDSVTDIVVADWPLEKTNRVFAGLINGELVVIENVGATEPKDSMFTFTIGFTRVSSLLLVENHLWCACGNSVFVFNTATLDYLGQFGISNNALDLILTMKLNKYGVWIAARGSPVIELRDVKTHARLLLFNTSNEMYVNHREDEEGTFNVQRVTALLPHENTVWVGTGNGDIIVYEICDTPGHESVSKSFKFDTPVELFKKDSGFDEDMCEKRMTSHGKESNLAVRVRPCFWNSPPPMTPSECRHTRHGVPVGPMQTNTDSTRHHVIGTSCNPHTAVPSHSGHDGSPNRWINDNERIPSLHTAQSLPEMRMILPDQKGIKSSSFTLSQNAIYKTSSNRPDALESLTTEEEQDTDVADTDSKLSATYTILNGRVEPEYAKAEYEQISVESGHEHVCLQPSTFKPPNETWETLPGIQAQASIEQPDHCALPASLPLIGTCESVASSGASTGIPDLPSVGSGDAASVVPTPNPVFCPLRKDSRLIEQPSDYSLRFQLYPILKNKVSETPIRMFLTSKNVTGETLIISCATFYNDDDAVLKWQRCVNEAMMWTNQPILHYDVDSQRVQFPAYMLNSISMRRESNRRITIATS